MTAEERAMLFSETIVALREKQRRVLEYFIRAAEQDARQEALHLAHDAVTSAPSHGDACRALLALITKEAQK